MKWSNTKNHWSKTDKREEILNKISITLIKKGQNLSPLTQFKKGQIGINKGKKFSKKWIKNISKAHKGITPITAFKQGNKTGANALNRWRLKGNIPWNKGKPWLKMRGKNHPNWKGGQPRERDILKGRWEYIVWRTAVFIRDDYTCQMCGTRGKELNADHIKPWSLYPELRYAIDNGRTLCVGCHRQTDTWGYKAVKLFINEDIGG